MRYSFLNNGFDRPEVETLKSLMAKLRSTRPPTKCAEHEGETDWALFAPTRKEQSEGRKLTIAYPTENSLTCGCSFLSVALFNTFEEAEEWLTNELIRGLL